jgi:sirohydrochlorin ferrochelatase
MPASHQDLKEMADNGERTAIIVFAHGSKVPEANESIARLAGEVSRCAGQPAAAAFLDVAHPDLRSSVDDAVRAGARRVLIVPCFLVFGVHVREDLPRLVRRLEAAHPGIEIVVSQPLEGHPGLAEILAERAREALTAEGRGKR